MDGEDGMEINQSFVVVELGDQFFKGNCVVLILELDFHLLTLTSFTHLLLLFLLSACVAFFRAVLLLLLFLAKDSELQVLLFSHEFVETSPWKQKRVEEDDFGGCAANNKVEHFVAFVGFFFQTHQNIFFDGTDSCSEFGGAPLAQLVPLLLVSESHDFFRGFVQGLMTHIGTAAIFWVVDY
jgi:hypothetical protein